MRAPRQELRLLSALFASAAAHALLLAAVSRGAPAEAAPTPFALSALSDLYDLEAARLAEGGRLVCAAFPFLCEEERFVELELAPEPAPERPDAAPDLLALLAPDVAEPEPPTAPDVKAPEPKPEDNPALSPPLVPPAVTPKARPKSVIQHVDKEDAANPDPDAYASDKTKIVKDETRAATETSTPIIDATAASPEDPEAARAEISGAEDPKIAGVEALPASGGETPATPKSDVPPAAAVTERPGERREGAAGAPGEPGDGAPALAEGSEAGLPKKAEGGERGERGEGGEGGPKDRGGRKGQPRLSVSLDDFKRLYETEKDAPPGVGDTPSVGLGGAKGKKREEFLMAQLANFVPEVKPGNQTALSTAADPFAKFLHQVHVQIHRRWGDGTLRDFDRLGGRSPLNDPALAVTLEIAVGADGTVEKAAPVGSSGSTMYDSAAILAVYEAGPFPRPPEAIRSYNGKTYLRWTLHRDNRQCATSFAEPYILAGAEPVTKDPGTGE